MFPPRGDARAACAVLPWRFRRGPGFNLGPQEQTSHPSTQPARPKMKVHAQVHIRAPKEAVWKTITDIKNAPNRISGIQKVEVLEQPPSGVVGLKWRETRTMFGKSATEVMWITKAVENSYYETRAESHGAIYHSRMS